MTASVKSIKIDQLDNSHRFYIFKRNKLNLNKLWENVLETVEEDIKTESHLQEMHAVEKVLASRKEKDSASALFAVLNPSINQESSHIKDNSKKSFFLQYLRILKNLRILLRLCLKKTMKE